MKNKLLKYFIALQFSLLIIHSSLAQLRQGEFTISNGYSTSIIQTNDRGYAMTGIYTSGINDLNIVKLDDMGNMQWNKTISGVTESVGSSIVQTSDGGYAATGYCTAYGAGGEDVYVVKLNSQGNLLWTRTIGGRDDDWGNSIIQTKDGGFAITGGTKSYGGGTPGYADIYVIKLDSQGNKIWTKTIEGPWGSDDEGNSIIQTMDGGYVIGGSALDNQGYGKVFVFKLDSLRNLKWSEAIGGTVDEEGESIVQTYDSGFAIVGLTASFVADAAIYVLKLNSTGKLIWSRTIGDSTVGYSVIQTKDKGFVVAGDYNDSGCICKIDSDGNLLWFNHIGSITSELNSVVQTKDGGFAATGNYSNVGMFVIKLDSSGNSCDIKSCGAVVGSGGTVTQGGIITSSDSGIMGSGGVIGNGGNLNTICKVTLVEDIDPGVETIDVYPNPGNGIFTIIFGHAELARPADPFGGVSASQTTIEVYNSMGQKVFDRMLNQVQHDYELNISNQPNGIYLCRILKDDGTLLGQGKLIIQK